MARGRDDDEGDSLFRVVVKEGGRVMAALVIFYTSMWFFIQPAAEKFVDGVINDKKLAPQSTVTEILSDVKELQQEQTKVGRALERLATQGENIEKAVQEQRSLLLEYVLEQRRRRP